MGSQFENDKWEEIQIHAHYLFIIMSLNTTLLLLDVFFKSIPIWYSKVFGLSEALLCIFLCQYAAYLIPLSNS